MRFALIVTALLAVAGCRVRPAPQPASQGMDGAFVVSTDWLAANRGDRDLVLIHVVQDSAYTGEQIPGSRTLWYRRFVKANGTVGTELPPVDSLRALLERVGVSTRSRVVVYAADVPMATRLLFTLDYLGHDRMAFLDGGLRKWKRENRAVTTDVVVPTAARFTPKVRESLVTNADWLTDRLDKPGISLIDTRTVAEFTGNAVRGGLPSTGHLAGARLLEWEWMFSDDDHSVLRPRAELERLFAERVRPGDQVVTYCWVGYRGSATYFIARHLGYDVKLYDGSFQDWMQRKLPVRTGEAP